MKNVLKTTIGFAAILSIVVGCAQSSSDPLSEYNVKGETPTDFKREQQTIAPSMFAIQIDGSNQLNSASFVEGETSSVYIKVIRKTPKIKNYTLQFVNFPSANAPVLNSTNNADIWQITWKPQPGFIPAGTFGRNINVEMKATVTSADRQELVGLSKTEVIPMIVSRNTSQPKITGRTDLSAGIDEGKEVSFSVDVEDPTSLSYQNPPQVQFIPFNYDNIEAFAGDISRSIKQDYSKKENPQRISNTKWRFHYVLRVDEMENHIDRKGKVDPNAPTVDLCTYVRAYSAVNTSSGDSEICLKGRFASKLATLNWTQANVTELNAGEEIKMEFQTSVDSKLGKMDVQSSVKDMNCETTSREGEVLAQVCQITLKPACTKKESKQTVKVSVTHTLNKKSKVANYERIFVVKPSEAHCATAVKSQTAKSQTAGGQK